MAEDKKISQLTVASALTGTETLEVVQGGVNKQTNTQEIANLGGASGTSIPFGSTSGTNTYTIAATPAVASYTNGMLLQMRVVNSSTGVVTLNFDSVGAKKLLDTDGTQATDGYLKAGVDYLISYNSALDGGVGAFTVVNEIQHGVMNLRGTYAASGGLYPSGGGSGPSGAIRHGDTWVISGTDTIGSITLRAGDLLTTAVDAPGQTASNWYLIPGYSSLQTELTSYVNEETFATLTYGATVNWDLNNRQSPLAKLVATGNFIINMTNVKSGCYGTLLITTNVGSTVVLTFDTDFTNKNMIRGATLTTWTFPNDNGAEYTCTFYVDGTTIRWFIGDVATPTVIVPTVKLRRAAVQNVPTADLTNPTSFDTEVIDNNSLWTAGSPTIIDAPAGAGNYTADVSVGVDFAAAAGGNVRRVWVYVNGAAVAGGMLESRQPTGGFNASGSTFVSGTIKVECASGDDITIVPYQDSGSTLTSTVTAYVIFYTR